MNSNNRIAATLYSLGTQFFFRNISINTLHKGDDGNNNNNNNSKAVQELWFSRPQNVHDKSL